MVQIQNPPPVKLIISVFSHDLGLIKTTEQILSGEFGPIDFSSQIINFNQTLYYQKEFGKDLKRKFLSFKKLINSEDLWKFKIKTSKLENKFKVDDKRQINIDPGYISLANLVLASTKNFAHRIHIQKGIFQELSMLFQDKTFKPVPWTYPDYQSKEYVDIFIEIRNILYSQLKHKT